MRMNFARGTGAWILGANFLQNYLTVFDYDNMRVGFVGEVGYADIPYTIMEYLTFFVLGLLLIVVIFVIFQLCVQKKDDGGGDDNYQQLHNRRGSQETLAKKYTYTTGSDSVTSYSQFAGLASIAGGSQVSSDNDRQQRLLERNSSTNVIPASLDVTPTIGPPQNQDN
jgi:hypothetical protein